MDANTLVASLQEAVPGAQIEGVPSVDLQTTIYVSREDAAGGRAGAARPPRARRSTCSPRSPPSISGRASRASSSSTSWCRSANRLRLRLKVRLPGDDAARRDGDGVWPAANWLEREVWDLFGIAFDGHPDPRRLLMPEDWEGFPLRKDYPVQIKMTPRTARAAAGHRGGVPRQRDEGSADARMT